MKKVILSLLLLLNMYAAPMGELMFNGNCLTCHAIDKANSAPSIKEIRHVYLQRFTTEEAFIAFMIPWIQKPNATTALMPEAIKKYALMPELGYDAETLKEIASYLYHLKVAP